MKGETRILGKGAITMKILASLIVGAALLILPNLTLADDYYYYDPYDNYYYDYNPYYNHGVYSTGYYFDPYEAYAGAHEYGAGRHVPTGSVASPYRHGVHHGYHWNSEEGWHSGSHYGHE